MDKFFEEKEVKKGKSLPKAASSAEAYGIDPDSEGKLDE